MNRIQLLQDAFAQLLWIAPPGVRKLDDLSSDRVRGGSTPSVCRSATRAISKATPMSTGSLRAKPQAVQVCGDRHDGALPGEESPARLSAKTDRG